MSETSDARSFGWHVRGLRRVRRLTQDQLAERCDLATDTIRRVEHGAFSPSLHTITKLCRGLGIARSTLFESLELCELHPALRELTDLLGGRSLDDVEFGLATLRTIFDQLDRRRGCASACDEESA